MAYFVYEYTLFRDYGYMNGVHFDEYWRQVGMSDNYDLAKGIALGKADQFAENHKRQLGEFVKEDATVGLYNRHKTIGGISVTTDPLPYMETGYYITTEDFGDERQCFTESALRVAVEDD